jgi:hypothetical protein
MFLLILKLLYWSVYASVYIYSRHCSWLVPSFSFRSHHPIRSDASFPCQQSYNNSKFGVMAAPILPISFLGTSNLLLYSQLEYLLLLLQTVHMHLDVHCPQSSADRILICPQCLWSVQRNHCYTGALVRMFQSASSLLPQSPTKASGRWQGEVLRAGRENRFCLTEEVTCRIYSKVLLLSMLVMGPLLHIQTEIIKT